jgi:glycerol-3-phosphate dehydrogenase
LVGTTELTILDQKTVFDHIVIGGGITGIGIFRDLAKHQQEVLILDRFDFCSQTSAKSSKMLHGGIRYLEQWNFDLVFEALKEKNIWYNLAPHLCEKRNFYIPIYKDTKYPKFMIMCGLKLYDLLSLNKNGKSAVLGREKTIEKLPYIKTNHLYGAGRYEDIVVDDIRLGIECLVDALHESRTYALNYHEVMELKKEKGYFQLKIRDHLNNRTHEVKAKNIAMATGPFTNPLLKKWNLPIQNIIRPSKGVHLWFDNKDLPIEDPMVFQTPDNRILFLIPQRHHVLVGTTDTALPENAGPLDVQVNSEDRKYLLSIIHEYLQIPKLTEKHIKGEFVGVRPLAKTGEQSSESNSAQISRGHRLVQFDHNGLLLIGGKYTTFRVMAQDLVKRLARINGFTYNPQKSLEPLRYGPVFKPDMNLREIGLNHLQLIIDRELVKNREDLLLNRLSFIDLKEKRNIFSEEQLSQLRFNKIG